MKFKYLMTFAIFLVSCIMLYYEPLFGAAFMISAIIVVLDKYMDQNDRDIDSLDTIIKDLESRVKNLEHRKR